MILNLIRAVFVLLVALVAISFLSQSVGPSDNWPYIVMVICVVSAFAIIIVDYLIKRKNLSAIAGLFLGILVGMLVTVALDYLLAQVFNTFFPTLSYPVITGTKLLLGIVVCYLSVSLILQTKDDFRFVVPYVEFSRATRGSRPFILDTSVIIDGRIADVAATGIFESRILVPRFVLNELQTIADSSDKLKRGRGKRGLDVLQKLQSLGRIELHIWDGTLLGDAGVQGVDQKLLLLAKQENGRIITNDFNLNKVAALQGVQVLNLNDLAKAVKPVVLPGETLDVRVIKPGEGAGQAVGYLEDGTMVVVEGARQRMGTLVRVTVTNSVQTSAGRMIFARLDDNGDREPDSQPQFQTETAKKS
jgi:uncharacterized protein YacL